jgi:TonB family protein
MNSVPAPPEFHALVADFRAQLQKAGIRKVLLRDFWSVEVGHFPLEDWFEDRVTEDLVSPPDGLAVLRAQQLKTASNPNGVGLSDTDAQISESVEPSADGMVVKLTAFRSSSATVESASEPVALAARDVRITDAMEPWVPEKWKALMVSAQTHPEHSAEQESMTSAPVCVYCPSPGIPFDDRRKGFHGTVRLVVTIGADGKAQDIRVVESGGKELDKAAIEAVKHWKFKPATDINGKPVTTPVTLDVFFAMM